MSSTTTANNVNVSSIHSNSNSNNNIIVNLPVKTKAINVDQDSDCDLSQQQILNNIRHAKIRKESYDNLKEPTSVKQPKFYTEATEMKTDLESSSIDHQRQRNSKNRSFSPPLLHSKHQRQQPENKAESAELSTVEDNSLSDNSMDETLEGNKSFEMEANPTISLSVFNTSQDTTNFSINQPNLPLNPTMNKIFSVKSQLKHNSNNEEEGHSLQTCKINLTPPLETTSANGFDENDNSNNTNNLSISETTDSTASKDPCSGLQKYGVASHDLNEPELDKVI